MTHDAHPHDAYQGATATATAPSVSTWRDAPQATPDASIEAFHQHRPAPAHGLPLDAGGWCLVAMLAGWVGVGSQLQQPDLLPEGKALAGGVVALGCAVVGILAMGAAGRRARAGRYGGPGAASGGLRRLCLRAGILTTAVLAGFLFGWVVTDLRASVRLADALSPDLEGRDLVVTGTVASLPRLGATGTRFVFDVESARLPEGTPVGGVPSRLWLGWFHGLEVQAAEPADPASSPKAGAASARPAWRLSSAPEHPLRAGDRWELPVRLKRPHGGMNPQGFDLELWMFERELGASGSVRPPGRRLQEDVAHPVDRLRQHLRDAIREAVPDPRAAGIVAALAVGDQAAIQAADWELFRLSGVAHLMSISGLHVTLFAWLAAAVLRVLWRTHPRLMLAVPAPTAGRWGGLLLASAYAVLAGWGVPAQRTVIMLAVVVALRSAGREWPGPVILLAAGVVVSAVDPWALLQPGFWLSFVAVGVLMAGEAGAGVAPRLAGHRSSGPAPAWRDRSAAVLRRTGHEVGAMLRTQALATIGLAPLTLVFFQQLSLAGFLANLVAIPYVTLVVTPLSLLGVLWSPLWNAAAASVGLLLPWLEVLAGWPGAVWMVPVAPAWAVLAGSAGAAIAVLPLPMWMRLMGLPLLLPLLWPPLARPAPGSFEVVAADVGQGTAVVVRTQRHVLVYDTGPVYTPESDAGQRVLVPMLRGRGEAEVHRLVLSHRDADHIGGAESLMAALPVAAVSSSLDRADSVVPTWPPGRDVTLRAVAARLADASHTRCADGQSWDWDGVRFEMLHPLSWEATARKANALSCVLRVVAADGTSLLLTGDIEAAQERALVRAHGEALRSTVMTVPHHGSRTSSTLAFLEAVGPRVALVQAAYRSHFGHPAPDVVARYEALGSAVVRSDRCGAWTWRSGEPAGVCERDRHRRYWHWRPASDELRSPARSPPDPLAPAAAPPAPVR